MRTLHDAIVKSLREMLDKHGVEATMATLERENTERKSTRELMSQKEKDREFWLQRAKETIRKLGMTDMDPEDLLGFWRFMWATAAYEQAHAE